MKLLLDTHTLLWWIGDHSRIGPESRSLLQDRGNQVLVSIVSLWKIAIKAQVGKLTSDIRGIRGEIGQDGFTRLDLAIGHPTMLTTLPRHHRDPFDHLLIAQAITEGATLMPEDGRMQDHPVPLLRPPL